MDDDARSGDGESEPRRVRVLPDALANQIAAGEVVERPASVVKELVENAIDAGANRILIDIEEAGRGLVRVVDDGLGMAPEDAALAVLRHATSKVRTAEDLAAIGTLGFRGEALPSIASVSRFLLVTRRAEDAAATAIKIEGGAAPETSAAASPVGTRIEVRDLFWNVPARLKFLKTDQTETQHVIELVKSFALGYPHIHFRLGTGAKVALDFPAVRRLFERVSQVLGGAAGRHLFEVMLASEYAASRHIRVTGFVSNAREAKATQSAMTTFVNGRRVKDRTMAHAVVSAFGSELAPGRFPQAVLWVHIDPADVDVNVHPAKAEVRFRQPQVVHEAVTRAIQSMLLRRPWLADAALPIDRGAQATLSLAPPTQRPQLAQAVPDHRPAPAVSGHPKPSLQSFGVGERFAHSRDHSHASEDRSSVPTHRTELRFGSSPVPVAAFAPVSPAASAPSAPSVALTPEPWRLLGRARGPGATMVAEGPAGLAVFEPQALYEALTRAELLALPRPIAAQPLLLPARLDLTPGEAQRLRVRLELLAGLGLPIEPFGGTTYQLLGLPLPALSASPVMVLGELAALASKGEPSEAAVVGMLAKLTARAVVSRGLDERQLAALVAFVPHGITAKTGVFLLSRDEIARRLHIEVPREGRDNGG